MDLDLHNHVEVWPLFFSLAGLVGFVAERASLCTVKAVKEILTTRRAYMLWCFAKTVLWVIGVTMLLAWIIDAPEPASLSFAILLPGLLAGVLFGVGAVLNRGCSLSTLTRLGSGDLGMITTLMGFVLGVAIYGLIEGSNSWMTSTHAAPWFDLNDGSAWMPGVVLSLWMLWESIRLWRTAPEIHWKKKLLASQYRLSTAAAILGVSNGILFALVGTWSYTHPLHHGVTELLNPGVLDKEQLPMLLWWLFIALLAGVSISAFLKRRFELAWQPQLYWLGYFSGGMLMGFGAKLVPGGNDVLLLNAIPGFSPHALPAYFAMLVGIAITLTVLKWFGGDWPKVDCRDDVCQESNKP